MYFVLPLLVALFFCIGFQSQIEIVHKLNNTSVCGSFIDYWIYFLQGGKQYKFDVYQFFAMPVRWICFYSLFLICISNYTYNDMKKYGIQVLVKSGNRFHWWLSKMLWMVCFAALYILVCLAVTVVYAGVHGGSLSMVPTHEIIIQVTRIGFTLCSTKRLFCILFVQPFLFLLLLGMIHISFSYVASGNLSFLALFFVLVLSTYKRSYALIGNWSMPYRMIPVAKHGLSPVWCVGLLLCGIAAAFLVGYAAYKRKDILGELK